MNEGQRGSLSAQWPAWRERLQGTISEKRYRHSLAVAEEAVRLARHWRMDEEKAYTAGLLHDVARDLPVAETFRIAAAHQIPFGAEERLNPIILHAPVGAVILAEDWGLSDAEVLAAVRGHTVAEAQMSDFTKLVFLADLIEPNRRNWLGLKQVRQLAYQDLDRAMLQALANNFRFLRKEKNFIHPVAYRAHEYFRQVVEEKERLEPPSENQLRM